MLGNYKTYKDIYKYDHKFYSTNVARSEKDCSNSGAVIAVLYLALHSSISLVIFIKTVPSAPGPNPNINNNWKFYNMRK